MPTIPSLFKIASKGESNVFDNSAAIEALTRQHHPDASHVNARKADAKRHSVRYTDDDVELLNADENAADDGVRVRDDSTEHYSDETTTADDTTETATEDDENAMRSTPKVHKAHPLRTTTVLRGGRKRISKVISRKSSRQSHPFSSMLLTLTPSLLINEEIKDVAQNVHLYFDGFWHLGTLYLTSYRIIFKPIVLSSYDDVPKIDNAEEYCSIPLTSIYRVEKVGGKTTRQEHGYLIEIWTKDLKHMRFSFRLPQRTNANNSFAQTPGSPTNSTLNDQMYMENSSSDRIRKRFGRHLKKEIAIAKFFAYKFAYPAFTLRDVLTYEYEQAMNAEHGGMGGGFGGASSLSSSSLTHLGLSPSPSQTPPVTPAVPDETLIAMLSDKTMDLDAKFDGWELYNVYMEFGLRQGILCDMETRHLNSLAQQRRLRNRILYSPTGEPPYRPETVTNPIRNWRTCSLNKNYEISETYPKIFCVPAMMTDEEVRAAAAFRSKGRIPVLCWCNPQTGAALLRSAQPMVGMLVHSIGRKSKILDDQRMIELIIGTNPSVKSLMIVDLRPKLNADANKLFKGAGYEKDYTNCDLRFMNIDNIHAMRSSYSKLIEVCINSGGSDMQFFSNVESTKWLEHLRLTLRAALFCVMCMEGEKKSVLLHCSDGWDRTSQVSSLTLIMIDPYYRTLEGFATLVEKEWCSFGHQFHKRIGPGSKSFFIDDRAPIFFQFLECVYQLLFQHPTAFEFTDQFLGCVMDELYGSRFGTFLYDSERERTVKPETDVTKRTPSLWTYILHPRNREKFVNPLYDPSERTTSRSIIPDLRKSHIHLWTNYWMRHIVPPNSKVLSQRIVNSTQNQMQRYYVYHKAFPMPRDAIMACGRMLLTQLKSVSEEKRRADQRNERTITTFQDELRTLWKTIEVLSKEKETLEERHTKDTTLLLRLCDKQRVELRKWRSAGVTAQSDTLALSKQAEQVEKLEQETSKRLSGGESTSMNASAASASNMVTSSPNELLAKSPSTQVDSATTAQLRQLYETKITSLQTKHNVELEELRAAQLKEFTALKRQMELLKRENSELAATVKQQQERLTELFPAPEESIIEEDEEEEVERGADDDDELPQGENSD